MKRGIEQRTIRKLLQNIEKRPCIYLGTKEKRIDYLCHFLDGWFINNKCEVNSKYCARMANWIYDWTINNRNEESSKVEFSFVWYKMIYSITNTEEEAWKLFFKLSYAFLDRLETEEN